MGLPHYVLQTTSRRTHHTTPGTRFYSYAEAAKEARRVSKMKWVLRVTMTRLIEEPEGVWRGGHRSR